MAKSKAVRERLSSFLKSKDALLLKQITLIVFVWRLMLEAINQIIPFIAHILPRYPDYLSHVVYAKSHAPMGLDRWAHWDGYHYLGIVTKGYGTTFQAGLPMETAFFPAFPATVRLIGSLFHLNYVVAGLLLNFFLTIALSYGVYKLAIAMTEAYVGRRVTKKQIHLIAWISVALLLFNPTSLFFAAYYGDALLGLGITYSLLFAIRKRYFWAVLFGIVATLSKSSGIIILPALLAIITHNEGGIAHIRSSLSLKYFRNVILTCSGAAFGLIIYMAYLWLKFGNPLMFVKVQELWGRYSSVDFIDRLYHIYYSHIFTPHYYGGLYEYSLMLIVMILPFASLWLTKWYWRKYKISWVYWMTVLLLILALSSAIMQSLNRYFITLTPLFVVIATLLVVKRVPIKLVALFIIGMWILLGFYTAGFLQGSYFAG